MNELDAVIKRLRHLSEYKIADVLQEMPLTVDETAKMQIVRLSQVFKSGSIVESVSMPDPDIILLTSDS